MRIQIYLKVFSRKHREKPLPKTSLITNLQKSVLLQMNITFASVSNGKFQRRNYSSGFDTQDNLKKRLVRCIKQEICKMNYTRDEKIQRLSYENWFYKIIAADIE